jgi:Icc-related predicted phosphoesterase
VLTEGPALGSIRVVEIDPAPLARVRYYNAARGGRRVVATLSIERARATGLPDELRALILTSDLQGIVPSPRDGSSQLLGVAVADELDRLAGDALPAAQHTGAILAGDLYSVPTANKRGGFGDVRDVWHAFADRFAWVAGVAGNHDDFGGADGIAELRARSNVFVLDGDVAEIDGRRIGGVGYVIGNPAKPGRRDEDDHLAMIDMVAREPIDVLVLHEGPCGEDDQPGNASIRQVIERHAVPFTVCGHCHWSQPLAELERGRGQIVNVDSRVLVLVR